MAKPTGDVVLASAHSKELVKKYGWKAATGNVPAAYLTGLLCGLKAKANGVSEAILDIGLVSPTKGSKVFATLSGVLDAGVVVPHDAEKLLKKRNDAEHIVKYAKSLGNAEEYAPKFSTVLAKGLAPEDIGEHFGEVKAAVFKAYGVVWKPEVKAKPEKAEKAEKVEAKAKPVAKKAEVKPAAPEVEAKPVAAKPAEVKAVEPEPVAAKAPTKKAKAKPAAAKAAEPEKVAEAEPAAVQPEVKTPKAKKAIAKVASAEAKPAKAEAKPGSAKPKAKAKAKVKSDAKTGGKKE
jgi:large subunit ribosomal protein L18